MTICMYLCSICLTFIQGEQGVIEVLELLKEELRLAMALSGNTHKRKYYIVYKQFWFLNISFLSLKLGIFN